MLETIREKEILISKFFMTFADEDLVWILYELKYALQSNEVQIELLLQRQNTLEELKEYLKQYLNKLDINTIQQKYDFLIGKKDLYINAKSLKRIPNDPQLHLILINKLITMNIPKATKTELNQYKWSELSSPLINLIFVINIILRAFKNTNLIIMEMLIGDIILTYSLLINYKSNLNNYIDDPSFLEWAETYISKKPLPYNISLITYSTPKEYILNYLFNCFSQSYEDDCVSHINYINIVNAIKKAWQQKQFRDQGKLKKKYHLPLTKQAKKELTKLAEFKNQRENSVLEDLIHTAYLNEICDEHGQSRF